MAKVFIVQEIMRRMDSGQLERIHDMTPAAVYGELVVLLSHSKAALTAAPTVHELTSKLRDFSDDDFLLAVGDPVNIGIATAVAAKVNHGRVKMLKWDREARSYIRIDFTI